MKNKKLFGNIQNQTLLCITAGLLLISQNKDIVIKITKAIIPFVLAYLTAFLINRAAEKLSYLIMPGRKFCKIIISVSVLVIGLLIGRLLLRLLITEAELLLLYIKENGDMLCDRMGSLFERLLGRFDLTYEKEKILSLAVDFVGRLTSFLLSALTELPGKLLSFGVFVCALFYFTADFNSVNRFLSDLLPENVKSFVRRKQKCSLCGLKECLLGYFVLFLLTASELFIIFLLIKCKSALLLAVILALFDMLPVVGVGGVLIPWAIIEYFSKEMTKSAVLAIGFLLISVVRAVSEPKIISSRLGVHPLVMIFSAYLFVGLFGGIGIIIAPIVVILIKIGFFERNDRIHLLRKY